MPKTYKISLKLVTLMLPNQPAHKNVFVLEAYEYKALYVCVQILSEIYFFTNVSYFIKMTTKTLTNIKSLNKSTNLRKIPKTILSH